MILDNIDSIKRLLVFPEGVFYFIQGIQRKKENPDLDTSDIKSEGEILRDEVASDMREAALDITRPARRQMNQEIYDKVSEIPGASTVMSAKQHFDFFSRFKKRKDDINEENNN